jgi:hypothetical protein
MDSIRAGNAGTLAILGDFWGGGGKEKERERKIKNE